MGTIKKVLFMGSKQIGLRVLQQIHALAPKTLVGIITIDDSNDTRTVLDGFRQFGYESKLPLNIAENRKQSEQIIEELQPDVCFVVGWYWLISEKTIEAVPAGFIGIHNSLLPRYRGGSPLIWQIINNERKAGFSLFSFTPGMDDGPIWAQGSVVIENQDYVSNVLEKLEGKTLEVLRDKYQSILDGSTSPRAQDHSMATYCAQRIPSDGHINWNRDAHDIYNFVRTQSDPYPGAFTYLDGQLLTIWKARVFDPPYYGTPGQIARIADDWVYVICGDNRAIMLDEVELNGRRGKASSLIRSTKARLTGGPLGQTEN